MIGKTISHYKILGKLGEGGMGVVYKAEDTKLKRTVALKFLPKGSEAHEHERVRFLQEAQAASALNHQNVTTIYEISEFENPATAGKQVYIAMEYVEGRTLKQLTEHEILPIKKVLDIAIQVCDGLSVAHEKGIVHRDIKSENIMLTPKGQIKIMDFGLAKVKGTTKLTKEGSTLGTAAYMSPEQAQGEEVDHRSDIFSFGVVLYELLTGKLPFRGEHHSALMYSIINEEPPPIARFNEKVTPEIERIVSRALAKDKEDRYQHADDILAEIRHERKKLEYAKAGYVGTAVPATAPIPISKRRLTRNVIGIFAVVVLAIIAFYLFYPRPQSTSATKKTIAVLPFEIQGNTANDTTIADGMMEDTYANLCKISAINVLSNTETKKYRGTNKTIREIGEEFQNAGSDVYAFLTASVRSTGNKMRITPKLIESNNERTIWAETYDRDVKDIFVIQSDVAKQIASALKITLSNKEVERIEKQPTTSITAYDYYLKGREYYQRFTHEDRKNAIKMFNNALEIDSSYALA